jgi:hypothetical protein
MPRALSRPCTAPPPRYTTYPCIHVDLPPPPGSSCMVLRRCIPFGAWPWEYMPRGMAMGIHATCAALSLLPTASLVATQLSSGLSALPVFAPHLFSLQCPPYRTVAAPQQRRPRSGANGWHCRLPGANLRQSPPTWRQSPPISAYLEPISSMRLLLSRTALPPPPPPLPPPPKSANSLPKPPLILIDSSSRMRSGGRPAPGGPPPFSLL